jgi:hypothetical protein
LNRYGLAIQSAQKLLAQDKLPENLATEAHITIARSAYALTNTDLARREFEETVKLSKNEMAAEAKYMLAQIEFENAVYDKCEKSIFALSENYASYDYWVAKGFLLLSDVYVKKGNKPYKALLTITKARTWWLLQRRNLQLSVKPNN